MYTLRQDSKLLKLCRTFRIPGLRDQSKRCRLKSPSRIPAVIKTYSGRSGCGIGRIACHSRAGSQNIKYSAPLRKDVPAETLQDDVTLARLQALQCNFCNRCGQPMELAVPPTEESLRHVCSSCGFVQYHNPKSALSR
jgi:ribosomal protein S27AE